QPSVISNLVVGGSGAFVQVTGTVAETILATIKVQGKSLGANGLIRITQFWNPTNNANAKTIRVRMGGIGGTDFLGAFNLANQAAAWAITCIQNTNALNAQLGMSSI